jgi:3-oxoacyl-[acyl-carrier protein] reductase
MDPLLPDKVALVTGGSRGIGLAIVREFLREGATVYFSYSKSGKDAEKAVRELQEEGLTKVEALSCSVTEPEQINSMLSVIRQKAGQIDILVNNAGITRDNFLMMLTEKDWEDVIKTNLLGYSI